MPKRFLYRRLPDAYRNSRMAAAVRAAVQSVTAGGRECRVLLLGAGVGLLAVEALQAGAKHVTCVERWGPEWSCQSGGYAAVGAAAVLCVLHQGLACVASATVTAYIPHC